MNIIRKLVGVLKNFERSVYSDVFISRHCERTNTCMRYQWNAGWPDRNDLTADLTLTLQYSAPNVTLSIFAGNRKKTTHILNILLSAYKFYSELYETWIAKETLWSTPAALESGSMGLDFTSSLGRFINNPSSHSLRAAGPKLNNHHLYASA